MVLSEAGKILLESRYFLSGETAGLFQRVAKPGNTWRETQFCQIMEDLLFLPNPPTPYECRDTPRPVISMLCAPGSRFNSGHLYRPHIDGDDP